MKITSSTQTLTKRMLEQVNNPIEDDKVDNMDEQNESQQIYPSQPQNSSEGDMRLSTAQPTPKEPVGRRIVHPRKEARIKKTMDGRIAQNQQNSSKNQGARFLESLVGGDDFSLPFPKDDIPPLPLPANAAQIAPVPLRKKTTNSSLLLPDFGSLSLNDFPSIGMPLPPPVSAGQSMQLALREEPTNMDVGVIDVDALSTLVTEQLSQAFPMRNKKSEKRQSDSESESSSGDEANKKTRQVSNLGSDVEVEVNDSNSNRMTC